MLHFINSSVRTLIIVRKKRISFLGDIGKIFRLLDMEMIVRAAMCRSE